MTVVAAKAKKDINSLSDLELKLYNIYSKDLNLSVFAQNLHSVERLQEFYDSVSARTSKFDLQSYDFSKDPDCSVVPKI